VTGLTRHSPTRLIFSLLLFSVGAPVAAQQPEPPAQRQHVVRRGDTLWDIARQYLRDPFQWPRIFNLNRSLIRDPDLIYPNQRFALPGLFDRAPELLGEPIAWTWQPARESAAEEVALGEPAGAADTLTLDLRRPVMLESEFRATPWMAKPVSVAWAGRVARVADPTAQLDRLPSMLRQFEQVHVGSLRQTLLAGDSLQIVRVRDSVDRYGQIIQPLALLYVDSVTPDFAIATVARLYDVAREGDPVVALSVLPSIPLGSSEPLPDGAEAAQGQIIDWLDDEIMHGTPDIAFIDLGEGAVRLGDELEVFMPSRRINGRGDIVPEELVGLVRVVRVEGPVATVRVVSVQNTAMGRGLPVRVVGRVQ
jgi:LysM repeat protein